MGRESATGTTIDWFPAGLGNLDDAKALSSTQSSGDPTADRTLALGEQVAALLSPSISSFLNFVMTFQTQLRRVGRSFRCDDDQLILGGAGNKVDIVAAFAAGTFVALIQGALALCVSTRRVGAELVLHRYPPEPLLHTLVLNALAGEQGIIGALLEASRLQFKIGTFDG
jgi:hypothetical protein